MVQYKVPQDVEADDKLLGPFSFRQFVYLLIAGGLIALAVGLFQIFPLLALIPLPPVLLFAALALPIKKDQPMETYLAAVVSYYLKPRNRIWMPGQKDKMIQITAPKIVEDDRTRDITGEEATHRLSFLADIVDTKGYAIKGIGVNHANAELAQEAVQAPDMFETGGYSNIENAIARDENQRHAEVIQGMKDEIARVENMVVSGSIIKNNEQNEKELKKEPSYTVKEPNTPVSAKPATPRVEKSAEIEQKPTKKAETKPTNPSIIELANNEDYSVATIAKEANRIKEREEGEVFISLH